MLAAAVTLGMLPGGLVDVVGDTRDDGHCAVASRS